MKEYKLSFTKEKNDCWYIDLPNWPFDHHNLMMVAGADDLCEELTYDGTHTAVDVIISKKKLDLPDYICLEKQDSAILSGAYYYVDGAKTVDELWICPVTLFVFGKYPNFIYLKKTIRNTDPQSNSEIQESTAD